MKCFQRCLSVLLCFVLLSLAFSLNANAEEIKLNGYKVNINIKFVHNNGTVNKDYIINPFDDIQDYTEYPMSGIPGTSATYTQTMTIELDNKNPIAKKGKPTTITLYNVLHSVLLYNAGWTNQYKYDNLAETIKLLVFYSDGTSKYCEVEKESSANKKYTLICDLEPEKDIVKLEYQMINNLSWDTSNYYTQPTYYVGENTASKGFYQLSIDQSSEESGLLKTVIQWLSGIKDGISNLFSNVSSGFSSVISSISKIITKVSEGFGTVVNSLTELPSKIWEFIENGLKSLFVPDEEYITGYKDNWDSLLSSRFGAIYEVGDIILDFAKDLKYRKTTSTINIPSVNLASVGIPFTFGGYTVKIIPDNFAFITDYIKTITSFIITVLFLNGLRKRYDEVMGVKQ